MTARRDEQRRRRWDRRVQIAVVLLALAAGVVAAWVGTEKAWQNEPAPTTTTQPTPTT